MNFLETLHEWMGESETPTNYIDWVGRSMIAACMGNRMFVRMYIGARDVQVYPNLYVVLIGPSVGFKSWGLKIVEDLIGTHDHPIADYQGRMNLCVGRTTAQGLYDAMRTRIRRTNPDGSRELIDLPHRGQIYLVSDELANNFGVGERAVNMVTTLTEFYISKSFSDRTRGTGSVHLENFTVNWLGATTADWMRMCLTKETILGGFLGRVILVTPGAKRGRIFKAERTPRWQSLQGILVARLNEILTMGQEFALPFEKTEQAEAVEEAWFMSKEDPHDDDPTISHWRRQHALSLKLAAIESIIRGDEPYITEDHMMKGQLLAEEAGRMIKDVVPSVVTNNPAVESTLLWMKHKGIIQRSDLNRHVLNNHGWRADDLDKWVRT